jgi:hypothetical protein
MLLSLQTVDDNLQVSFSLCRCYGEVRGNERVIKRCHEVPSDIITSPFDVLGPLAFPNQNLSEDMALAESRLAPRGNVVDVDRKVAGSIPI